MMATGDVMLLWVHERGRAWACSNLCEPRLVTMTPRPKKGPWLVEVEGLGVWRIDPASQLVLGPGIFGTIVDYLIHRVS